MIVGGKRELWLEIKACGSEYVGEGEKETEGGEAL